MGEKRLTIRDIAKITGVSYATVSRALSGSPGINYKTRAHIKEVCDNLGYTANIVARSLAIRKSKLIGFILGSVDNPYMGQLACQVELYAREKGYTLILCNSMNREQHEAELFSLLFGRQVDGVLMIPSSTGSFAALERYLNQVPTVFIGENLMDSRKSYVAVDNYQGTVLGTEYLISLGHKSIVYLGCRPASITHELRYKGYADTCKKYGLEPHLIENHEASSSIANGYQLAKKLFAGGERGLSGPAALPGYYPYTAIFAATDTIALGVMEAADEAGIAIPDDISLIGYDNISYSMLPRINLTTIEQPFSAIASAAVDALIHTIEDPAVGYSHMVFAPTLVKRGTCRPPAQRPGEQTA